MAIVGITPYPATTAFSLIRKPAAPAFNWRAPYAEHCQVLLPLTEGSGAPANIGRNSFYQPDGSTISLDAPAWAGSAAWGTHTAYNATGTPASNIGSYLNITQGGTSSLRIANNSGDTLLIPEGTMIFTVLLSQGMFNTTANTIMAVNNVASTALTARMLQTAASTTVFRMFNSSASAQNLQFSGAVMGLATDENLFTYVCSWGRRTNQRAFVNNVYTSETNFYKTSAHAEGLEIPDEAYFEFGRSDAGVYGNVKLVSFALFDTDRLTESEAWLRRIMFDPFCYFRPANDSTQIANISNPQHMLRCSDGGATERKRMVFVVGSNPSSAFRLRVSHRLRDAVASDENTNGTGDWTLGTATALSTAYDRQTIDIDGLDPDEDYEFMVEGAADGSTFEPMRGGLIQSRAAGPVIATSDCHTGSSAPALNTPLGIAAAEHRLKCIGDNVRAIAGTEVTAQALIHGGDGPEFPDADDTITTVAASLTRELRAYDLWNDVNCQMPMVNAGGNHNGDQGFQVYADQASVESNPEAPSTITAGPFAAVRRGAIARLTSNPYDEFDLGGWNEPGVGSAGDPVPKVDYAPRGSDSGGNPFNVAFYDQFMRVDSFYNTQKHRRYFGVDIDDLNMQLIVVDPFAATEVGDKERGDYNTPLGGVHTFDPADFPFPPWKMGTAQRTWFVGAIRAMTASRRVLLKHQAFGGNIKSGSAGVFYSRSGGFRFRNVEEWWIKATCAHYGFIMDMEGHEHWLARRQIQDLGGFESLKIICAGAENLATGGWGTGTVFRKKDAFGNPWDGGATDNNDDPMPADAIFAYFMIGYVRIADVAGDLVATAIQTSASLDDGEAVGPGGFSTPALVERNVLGSEYTPTAADITATGLAGQRCLGMYAKADYDGTDWTVGSGGVPTAAPTNILDTDSLGGVYPSDKFILASEVVSATSSPGEDVRLFTLPHQIESWTVTPATAAEVKVGRYDGEFYGSVVAELNRGNIGTVTLSGAPDSGVVNLGRGLGP